MVDLRALETVLMAADGELASTVTPEIEVGLTALGLRDLLDHAREVRASDKQVIGYIVTQIVNANRTQLVS